MRNHDIFFSSFTLNKLRSPKLLTSSQVEAANIGQPPPYPDPVLPEAMRPKIGADPPMPVRSWTQTVLNSAGVLVWSLSFADGVIYQRLNSNSPPLFSIPLQASRHRRLPPASCSAPPRPTQVQRRPRGWQH